MESTEGFVEIDRLERGLLLANSGSHEDIEAEAEADDEPVLYSASFEEAEENFINYKTAQWVLYSLLLILAWGIGVLMFLYLPVQRYILRQVNRSRKLYVTPTAIIYKVNKPVPFPCFGVLKKEKHVLLPLVADIVIEQGYLQSRFGVYSIRIENAGVQRPRSDDAQIEGIANPQAFRKAILTHLSHRRSQTISRQGSTMEDASHSRVGNTSAASMCPLKSLKLDSLSLLGELAILQKLEEVGSSVKRIQNLIEERQPQTSDPIY